MKEKKEMIIKLFKLIPVYPFIALAGVFYSFKKTFEVLENMFSYVFTKYINWLKLKE